MRFRRNCLPSSNNPNNLFHFQHTAPFPGVLENGRILLVGHMGMYDYRPYVRKITNNRQIMYECERHYTLNEGPGSYLRGRQVESPGETQMHQGIASPSPMGQVGQGEERDAQQRGRGSWTSGR
ncbi:protein lev-9 [Caerostris extrusa]|uniref:Protein lev-9 n=1 Tax=Caerostris extrusa TaxID=172846 RepID=A0AAV4WK13_CAEEX|nr:protein lev-9 [Caerostris extrusa]